MPSRFSAARALAVLAFVVALPNGAVAHGDSHPMVDMFPNDVGEFDTPDPGAAPSMPSDIRTAGCPAAFVWHIRYEMRRTANGEPRSPWTLPIAAAQAAADFVGRATDCAAALHFHAVDDSAPWVSRGGSDDLARLRAREATPGPWNDADLTLLARVPPPGETFRGITDGDNIVVGYDGANEVLFVHELLHVFESFYTAAPWPDRDPDEDAIHEMPLWDYPVTFEGVAAFHRDLLSGNVADGLGMRRDLWAAAVPLRERKAADRARGRVPSPTRRLSVRRSGPIRRGGVLLARGTASPGAHLSLRVDQRGSRNDRLLAARARRDGTFRKRIRGIRTSGVLTVRAGRDRARVRFRVRR